MENKEYTNIETGLFVEGIGQVANIKTISDKAVRVNIIVKTDKIQRYIDTIIGKNSPINKGDIVSFWGFYSCSFLKHDNHDDQAETSPAYARVFLKNSKVQCIPEAEGEQQEQGVNIHIPAAVFASLNKDGLFKVFPSGTKIDEVASVDIAAIADGVKDGIYTGSVVGTLGPTLVSYNKPSFYIYDATICILT